MTEPDNYWESGHFVVIVMMLVLWLWVFGFI